MPTNPYDPPAVGGDHQERSPGMVHHRTFRAGTFAFLKSARRQMDELRADVQKFVNYEVGPEHVISIAEHTGFEYSIAVWYWTPLTHVGRGP